MSLIARLDPSTYSGDEVVGVAAVGKNELPGPVPNDSWRYIPERMWYRILSLGSAYELHFATVADPNIDTVFDSVQCDTVDEELRFLEGIVKDEAVEIALGTILAELQKVRGRSSMALVVSPP